jgi:hypothetical protein
VERLGGLQIDDQIKFHRLLHWQICWLLALQNPTDIDALPAISICEIGPIAHQTASSRTFTPWAKHRKLVTCRQIDEFVDLAVEKYIGRNE